jgi:hypothetical protein
VEGKSVAEATVDMEAHIQFSDREIHMRVAGVCVQ